MSDLRPNRSPLTTRLAFVLTAVLLAACATTPKQGGGLPGSPEASREHEPVAFTLPNGLDVVLLEDRTAPVAAFQLWVRVGAADETPDEAGIAHVFEHMMFKGTEKREVGQIGREVSAAGGDINAYTSSDQTVYHLVVPSNRFDVGLDIIADSMQNSTFDAAELEKELEVVVEEIRRGKDNHDRALGEIIDQKAYKEHPYQRPVIGFEKTVRSFTREDMIDFYKKWYVPANMTLVVVGDFDPQEVRGQVGDSFSNFKYEGDPKSARPDEPPQKEIRIAQDTFPFQREKVGLAFHIPSIYNEDAYVMDVIAEIVGRGSNSLLIDRLVHDLGIAVGVYAYSYTPMDPGMFTAGATIEPKDREQVIREVVRILFSVAHGNVPPRRLELAKTQIASDFVYRMESAQGMAGQLGYFKSILDDLDFEQKYLSTVQGITAERAAEVARKYLHPDNLTIGVAAPNGADLSEDERLREIVREEWEKAAAEAAEPSVAEEKLEEGAPDTVGEEPLGVAKLETQGDTTIATLTNGVTLLVTPDTRLPIVSVAGGFKGGLRYEPAELAGIANFTAAMLKRGTRKYTREQIADRLEAMAGSFGARVGSDFFTVSIRYLNEEGAQKRALDLFSELLLRPTFPEEEIANVKKQILPQFALREDNLFQVALLDFLPAMFGENGYGRMSLGDQDVVSSLSHEQLAEYHAGTFTPDSFVVSVVGDVDPESFINDFAAYFAEHRQPGETSGGEIDLPPLEQPVTETIRKEKNQSHVMYGWRAVGAQDDDRYALEVLNAITAGMGGRLFLELRDRQSLAYVVTSILPMRQEAGAYIVYIASAPDKLDQAIEGIRQQMKSLREKGVLEKEVEEAKQYLIGNLAVDRQTRGARASSMLRGELSGLGFRYEEDEYPERIQSVTVEDVNRAVEKYLDPDEYVLIKVE